MTTRIYVQASAISRNAAKQEASIPPVYIDKEGESRQRVFGVEIHGPSRVVYSVRRTHQGAHVWIETEADVTPLTEPVATEA